MCILSQHTPRVDLKPAHKNTPHCKREPITSQPMELLEGLCLKLKYCLPTHQGGYTLYPSFSENLGKCPFPPEGQGHTSEPCTGTSRLLLST